MARVEITKRELDTGLFPAICAKSGEPTDNIVEIDVRLPHPRTRWLLLPGVLPYFVYRLAFARHVTARVPLSTAILELRNREHVRLVGIGVVGTTTAAGGLLAPAGFLRVTTLTAGLLIAVIIQAVLATWRREAHIRFIRTSYDTIILERIHPAFRDALATGGPDAPGPVALPADAARQPTPTAVAPQRSSTAQST